MSVGPNRPGTPDKAREAPMTPALEKLAELVRQAEAKTRARKIEGETQHAAEQFRRPSCGRGARWSGCGRCGRPASGRSSRPTTTNNYSRSWCGKLALYKSSLASEADAERLIAASQAEIERTRRQTRLDLEEVTREVEEARRELRVATDQYRQLRTRDRPAPARAGRAVRRRGSAALGRRGPFPRRPTPAPGPRG